MYKYHSNISVLFLFGKNALWDCILLVDFLLWNILSVFGKIALFRLYLTVSTSSTLVGSAFVCPIALWVVKLAQFLVPWIINKWGSQILFLIFWCLGRIASSVGSLRGGDKLWEQNREGRFELFLLRFNSRVNTVSWGCSGSTLWFATLTVRRSTDWLFVSHHDLWIEVSAESTLITQSRWSLGVEAFLFEASWLQDTLVKVHVLWNAKDRTTVPICHALGIAQFALLARDLLWLVHRFGIVILILQSLNAWPIHRLIVWPRLTIKGEGRSLTILHWPSFEDETWTVGSMNKGMLGWWLPLGCWLAFIPLDLSTTCKGLRVALSR